MGYVCVFTFENVLFYFVCYNIAGERRRERERARRIEIDEREWSVSKMCFTIEHTHTRTQPHGNFPCMILNFLRLCFV